MNLEKNTSILHKNLTIILEIKDRLSDYNERIAMNMNSTYTEK